MRTTGSFIMILLIAILLTVFCFWAYWAELDQVTRGEGKLIPPSKTQYVQSLEGGIVTQIFIAPGARVEAGEPLITIDDTQFRSTFGENEARRMSLIGRLTRLRAEIDGEGPVFPEMLVEAYPDVIATEIAVLEARRSEYRASIGAFDNQEDQRQAEISELRQKIAQLSNAIALTQREIDLVAPLIERRIRPELDMIQLERDMNEYTGQRATTREALTRVQAALREVSFNKQEAEAAFIRRAREEIAEANAELNQLTETLVGDADRIQRTTLNSPVNGVVNDLKVTTVGQVAKPGEALIEIVPDEESLVVEVDIRPADIAFLRPGLPAKVRLTAYDFADYGSLTGEIETIGADTVEDAEGNRFYKVLVRTKDVLKDTDGSELETIPGMVATVDILVGKTTVLEYFTDPIRRLSETALREP